MFVLEGLGLGPKQQESVTRFRESKREYVTAFSRYSSRFLANQQEQRLSPLARLTHATRRPDTEVRLRAPPGARRRSPETVLTSHASNALRGGPQPPAKLLLTRGPREQLPPLASAVSGALLANVRAAGAHELPRRPLGGFDEEDDGKCLFRVAANVRYDDLTLGGGQLLCGLVARKVVKSATRLRSRWEAGLGVTVQQLWRPNRRATTNVCS